MHAPDDPDAPRPPLPVVPREPPSGSDPASLLRVIGVWACRGRRGDDGQPVLITKAFFDRTGPRRVALDYRGEAELGIAVITVFVAAFALQFPLIWLTAHSFGWLALLGLFALGMLGRPLRSAGTRWLDGIAARSAQDVP